MLNILLQILFQFLVPHPEIVRPPHSVSLRPGKSAFFECLAWSYSGLVYDWYKRTNNISTNSVISYNRWSENGSCISTIYALSISNVQLSDEGLYCCVATNDYGSVEECAWLEVNSELMIACCTAIRFSTVVMDCQVHSIRRL